MSSSLAFAMLRLHQHQARNLDQQQRQQRLFLTFLDGDVTEEQYGRNLELTLQSGETSVTLDGVEQSAHAISLDDDRGERLVDVRIRARGQASVPWRADAPFNSHYSR